MKQTSAISLITNLSTQNTKADFLNCVDFVAAHAYILVFLNFYHLNSQLTSYVLLPSPSPGSALVMSQFLSKFVMLFRSFLIWLFSLTNIYYVL